ncbi:hypothetical protein KIN20_018710 [Parelaphostrongylus tenuis]|uniref:Uncharacterized protein n=1 Tax=Parelaphostrongylus tenuis TaxID=148309 RepID=A0AAD5MNF1_PARTN|nr:hypothetical protein KIN20_018710 [Parelaphostrongylus tenuis]
MANCSTQVWQNVVNRAIRMLASGPFGSHFFPQLALPTEIEMNNDVYKTNIFNKPIFVVPMQQQ